MKNRRFGGKGWAVLTGLVLLGAVSFGQETTDPCGNFARWRGSEPAPSFAALDRKVANAADEEAARALIRAHFLPLAEELMKHCQREKLYAERDRLCQSLIQLDPDHAVARRYLRYSRRNGVWVQRNYRAPKNRSLDSLKERRAQREGLERAWAGAVARSAEHFDPEGEDCRRHAREILILMPDDAASRTVVGEVRQDGAWVLNETHNARKRRRQLEDEADEIRKRPNDSRPVEHDDPMPWRHVLTARYGTVLATGDADEARAVLRAVESAGLVFERAFGESPLLPEDFIVYVLDDRTAEHNFIESHPGAAEWLYGSNGHIRQPWLDGNPAVALRGLKGRAKTDVTTRRATETLLVFSFGLRKPPPWVLAGFGLRLGELVVGDASIAPALLPANAKWKWKKNEDPWQSARQLAARGELPALTDVVAIGDRELNKSEALLAYALTCYLVEGWPQDTARLLDDMGYGGHSLNEASQRILGYDIQSLEERFDRWLAERSE